MSAVKFSRVTSITKSWVAETQGRMVVELFSGRVVAEVERLGGVYESRQEAESKKLQNEIHSLCHHAIHQLLPIAGSYQQALLDDVAQAYMVYASEEAESILNRGNRAIEGIKGYVSGIHYNVCKIREVNRKVSELENMHAKTVMYHNSTKPYMDTPRFHAGQLKHILYVA